jgi:hypothetical protein
VRDPRSKVTVDNSGQEQNDDQSTIGRQLSGGSDSEGTPSQGADTSKTKIDYRNDPRFKVKIKPASDSTQRRYGGCLKKRFVLIFSSTGGINAGNSGIVLSLSVLTRGSALCILGSCFIDVFD